MRNLSVRQHVLVGCGAATLALAACATKDAAPTASSSSLGAVTEFTSPAPSGSNTPHLALDANGQVLLSWTQRRPDSTVAIQMSTWNGTAWDSVRTIADNRQFFVNWADFPAITALANGDLAAHWLEREGDKKYAYGVRVVRSTDGGRTWGAPITPHTDGLLAEHGFVSLWPEGDSDIGLVWLDGRKSAMPDSAREMTIRAASVSRTGALSREALLDARTCDCCQTGTTATRSGRILVYRDRSAEEIRDIAIVRQTATGWTPTQKVHNDEWHYPGCPVNGPQAAAVGDTVVVAWFTGARDTAKVNIARSVDGGATFGPPLRVDDGDPIGRVDVVLDDDANPVVVWLEQRTPTEAEVLARRIVGNALGETRVLSRTSGARQSGFPRLVRHGNDVVAAWTSVNPLQVHLARFSLSQNSTR
ncbi:sialidase family protein [Gemmatimonas sp.]|uniref:sialidase family protein n=1 Tax=Gemmatimonas sp. TaxID=1962908 RepID=UPI003340DD3E